MNASLVHHFDPVFVQFSLGGDASVALRWYGMAYLAGFACAYGMIRLIAQRGRADMSVSLAGRFVLTVMIGTMLGGRIGYALFYNPREISDLFNIWKGGMASHGGMIGIILACWWFAKRHGLNWLRLGDLCTLGGSIGIFFGRCANFINGELFGREASHTLPWAVKFPSEMYLWYRHDANLASPEFLPRLQDAVPLIGVTSAQWQDWCAHVSKSLEARQEILGAMEKLITATQHSQQNVIAALEPLLTPRHPSRLYAALLEGLLLFAIVCPMWFRPMWFRPMWFGKRVFKPGVIGATWLVGYATVRIIGEEFRMPDAHIGFEWLGLTRGQWLSVGMLLASIGALIYALKSNRSRCE